MSYLKLQCKLVDHQNKDIQFICVNQECQNQRLACIDCLKQFHDQHVKDAIDQNNFAQWKEVCEQMTDKIKQIFNEFQSLTQRFKKLIDYQIKDTNLAALTTEQAKQFINRIIKLKTLSPGLMEELNQLSIMMKQILSKFKSKNKQNSQIQPNLIELQNKIYDKQPGTFSMIKLQKQKQLSQKQQVNFQFSMENQGDLVQTKYEGKIIQLYRGFCLCQPPIPSEHIEEISFAFKIIKMEESNIVFLGVGSKSLSETKTFQENYYPGYYICSQGNVFWNNIFLKTEGENQPFRFCQNDIITVIVDNSKKKLVWIKKGTHEIFTTNFQNSQDFYPCIGQIDLTNSHSNPILACIIDD